MIRRRLRLISVGVVPACFAGSVYNQASELGATAVEGSLAVLGFWKPVAIYASYEHNRIDQVKRRLWDH